MKKLDTSLEFAMIQLVQGGVWVPLPYSMNIEQFLYDELGLEDAFVAKQIQTVILNGAVVDTLAESYLLPYTRLALAVAMPGLLGAALRRGGIFGRLREGITASDQRLDKQRCTNPCIIELRLFGSLTKSLAPILLQHGFFVAFSHLTPALQCLAKSVELSPFTWYTEDIECEDIMWMCLDS